MCIRDSAWPVPARLRSNISSDFAIWQKRCVPTRAFDCTYENLLGGRSWRQTAVFVRLCRGGGFGMSVQSRNRRIFSLVCVSMCVWFCASQIWPRQSLGPVVWIWRSHPSQTISCGKMCRMVVSIRCKTSFFLIPKNRNVFGPCPRTLHCLDVISNTQKHPWELFGALGRCLEASAAAHEMSM